MTDQQAKHPMQGFDPRWASPEDYIIGITKQIWEDRGLELLHDLYAPEIPVRFPGGSTIGNQPVIESTQATLAEFPDRQLLAEDVIWSDDGDDGFLSSHRILSTATHVGDGAFGPASGTKLVFRTVADCAARANVIYDEWLVRDVGAMVRQLGHTPRDFAAATVEHDRATTGDVVAPLTPTSSPAAVYTGRGNEHEAGGRYADLVQSAAAGDSAVIEAQWDRAVQVELPGGHTGFGWDAVSTFWGDLRRALPDATLTIEHQIGRTDTELGTRAALRWWYSGTHGGDGVFGPATGAPVHIMGISHAEFGPWGLRREWILYDEVAVWKQIVLHEQA